MHFSVKIREKPGKDGKAEISGSFLWLVNAGVAIPSYNATAPRISLTQNEDSSLFKLYSSDVGLLSWQYGDALRRSILLEDEMLNLGGVFENYAAQELNVRGFPLFFYLQPRSIEVDFLIAWRSQVLPVEVKSGREYQKHASLDKIMQDEQNGLKQAFVLSPANLSVKGNVCYLPIYLCGWIRKEFHFPALDIPSVPDPDGEG